MSQPDPRIGADVVYHVNKRETPGHGEQAYEPPGRGIVTAVTVGPNVAVITVHGKRHDGTEHDVTLIEGQDVIDWPERTPAEPDARTGRAAPRADPEGTVKKSISMPTGTWKAAAARADSERMSYSAWVTRAVQQALSRDADRDRALAATAEFIETFEAEHGPISAADYVEASALLDSFTGADAQPTPLVGGIPAIDCATGDWKQLVLHYPPRESGSGLFATWERGAPVIKLYAPTGRLAATWDAPDGATPDQVIRFTAEITGLTDTTGALVQFVSRVHGADDDGPAYPEWAIVKLCTLDEITGALAVLERWPGYEADAPIEPFPLRALRRVLDDDAGPRTAGDLGRVWATVDYALLRKGYDRDEPGERAAPDLTVLDLEVANAALIECHPDKDLPELGRDLAAVYLEDNWPGLLDIHLTSIDLDNVARGVAEIDARVPVRSPAGGTYLFHQLAWEPGWSDPVE
jgi:hypothetical protein